MLFFFPAIADEIDWNQPYEFLDKELQQVVREAEVGRHTVDKLVKVKLLGGSEVWLLIHIEVQSQVDTTFARRIFVSNYRLFARFIDWVLALNPALEQIFRGELSKLEEAEKMRYVTSIERLALQEGLEQGREEGGLKAVRESVMEVIKLRFNEVPEDEIVRLNAISDFDQLRDLLRLAVTAGSLEEFERR